MENGRLESRDQHDLQHNARFIQQFYGKTIFEVAGGSEALSVTSETLQTGLGTLTVPPVGPGGSFHDQTGRL